MTRLQLCTDLFLTLLLVTQPQPGFGVIHETRGQDHKKTEGQLQTPDLNQLGPDVVKFVFNAMRNYGESERDRANRESNKNVNQYLVVLVASEEEIRKKENWLNAERPALPARFTQKDGDHMHRVAFLLNWQGHGLPFYNPDRELHGEVHAIDLGPLKRLMDNFKGDNKRGYPLVLMYSHYIPCAHVPRLGYSCAEEIKNFAKDKFDEYSMLVAYSMFFSGTDVQSSLKFMKEGGVQAFKAMQDSYKQTVKVYPPSSIDGKGASFQEEYYDCLMLLPVSKCCAGAQKNRLKIVSYFINSITYECTAKSKASRGLTERSRKELLVCIGHQIDSRVGSDCVLCSNKAPADLGATKGLFKFCLQYSLLVTNRLGRPKDANDPYLPEWVPCDCPWNILYQAPPRKSRENRHTVVCANWVLSLESMCTIVERGEDKKAKKLVKALRTDDRFAEYRPNRNRRN